VGVVDVEQADVSRAIFHEDDLVARFLADVLLSQEKRQPSSRNKMSMVRFIAAERANSPSHDPLSMSDHDSAIGARFV
jgi:hypothetical protein